MAAEMITNALASTFVERTIDNLASRFGDIFRGRKSNKKLLSNLKVKLLAIDVVADDAEQKQFINPRVREWLLAAKGVMFDAEDLLEEIDHALSKSQAEAESQSAAKKVWNSLKSSFVSFFENEIESRLEKLIEDLEDLATQSHVLGLKRASDVGVGSGSCSKLRSTYLPNESVIYGRDEDKEFVFKWLTSETHNNLSILSIVGMGGVGKTTLAQHVFNDPRIDESKFDVKAWVCVSDEFDVFKVSKAILDDVTGSPDDSTNTGTVHKRLKEKLTGKKFLLILDDVWNKNQSKWEEVQKPLVLGAQGSRILVTTRNKDVASIMRSKVHSLKLLQEDDCWNLFAKHAFSEDDTQPNPECREIGMKIVKKCNGVPLALKTMGSLLYNKSSLSEWETVFQSEIWEFSKESCDIVPALALSYIHLPSHLKVCFAYCALFPKDFVFENKDLIQLWMTENFICCPQHSKTPEEVCHQYFNELLSRSFFQKSDEKEELFVMHDLLHDLARYVGGGIYLKVEVDQIEKIQKETRHFSVEPRYNKYFDGFGSLCDTERLRTFMPTSRHMGSFWHWNMNISIHELFSKFKFLRILSLSCCSDIKEVHDSVANFELLRSLDLSYTSIKKLSEKICSLSHLQILKLNYCKELEELPSNLHLLTNLCCLEFMWTKVRTVPPHLEKLKNLKVMMSHFNVGHNREFSIQRLGELNLHKSLWIGDLQNIENSVDALEADLKNKTHLMELHLIWERNGNSINSKNEEGVIENLQPFKQLKKLSITRYGGKQFPNWLLQNSLWNLICLVLAECESCQHLPPLGLLPSLEILRIEKLDEIVSIDADFYGNNSFSFKSLKVLEFTSMKQWEKWECKAVTGAFPRLERLSIISCPKLKGQLPDQLVPLEDLHITYCKQLKAPKALQLFLSDCENLQLEWGTMKGINMGASLQEIVRSDTLEQLSIDSPLDSINDDYVSVRTFPLHFFPILRSLSLTGFHNLQKISQDHTHNHLEHLTILRCPKFEPFTANMHMLFPSLKDLFIEDAPILESFPEGGLPSNLKEMTVNNCGSLVGSLKRAFGDNSSLECLWIDNLDAKYFPDEGLLPLSLTSLTIRDCPNLEKLDYKGLYQLSFLTTLVLVNCLNLQSLPEEGLPKSISYLKIRKCPLLKQRCQKGGEDYVKIVHIKHVKISDGFVLNTK